jgi:hypothetical protein
MNAINRAIRGKKWAKLIKHHFLLKDNLLAIFVCKRQSLLGYPNLHRQRGQIGNAGRRKVLWLWWVTGFSLLQLRVHSKKEKDKHKKFARGSSLVIDVAKLNLEKHLI